MCVLAAPAQAQEVGANVTASHEIAAPGDTVTVTVELFDPGFYVAFVEATVPLDPTVAYLPNSVSIEGVPTPDDDPRVEILPDQINVRVGDLWPGVSRQVSYRLQVRGDIGASRYHRVTTDALFVDPFPEEGRPTRIEDEGASLHHVPVVQDAELHEGNRYYNFGISPELRLGEPGGKESRPIFLFAAEALSGQFDELVRGWAETWAAVPGDAGSQITAHEVQETWTEGTGDNTNCTTVGGVSWSMADCASWWDDGGKIDASPAGSIVWEDAQRLLDVTLTGPVQHWLEHPEHNFGALLAPQAMAGPSPIALSSKEGATRAVEQPRLTVVGAPLNQYDQAAIKQAKAEIVPTIVNAGISNQFFRYFFLVEGATGYTGFNRLEIDLPAGFSAQSVDSLLIGGTSPVEVGGIRADSVYEVWSLGSQIVLHLPVTVPVSADVPIEVWFSASTPAGPADKLPFVSRVDHDRRGFPGQLASKGPANDDSLPLDDDTWEVQVLGSGSFSSIEVAPADTTVALGQEIAYRAYGIESGVRQADITDQVTWSVNPPDAGSFAQDGSGILQTAQLGPAVVTADFEGTFQADANLSVSPPVVESLVLQPPAASIAAGDTITFDLIAVYTDGATEDRTAVATWSVGDSLVGNVVAPGSIWGKKPGSTSIDVEDSGLNTSGTLDVGPARLIQLSVSPADTTLPLGVPLAYQAEGRLSDAKVVDLTDAATWTSSDPDVAVIGSNGLMQSLAEGSSSISATIDSVASAPASLTVTSAEIVALNGIPDQVSLAVGANTRLISVAIWTDGSTSDASGAVIWQSLDPAVATSLGGGMVGGVSAGTARITHSIGTVEGDTLLVDVRVAVLDSLTVEPRPSLLPVGVGVELSAIAHYDDGEVVEVTDQANWSSSVPAVATVDPDGLLRTQTAGATAIQADFGGTFSDPISLTVADGVIDALVVTPADTTVAVGMILGHRAVAHIGPDRVELTPYVQWASADTAIVASRGPGDWLAKAIGATTVSADFDDASSAPASIQVDPAALVAIQITPPSIVMSVGETLSLTATGTSSDGSTADLTTAVTWTTADPVVATISGDGTLQANGVGSTEATAELAGIVSDPADVDVLPSVLARALPTGQRHRIPGTERVVLLTLDLENTDAIQHRLDGLRTSLTEGTDDSVDSLYLYLDDGDQAFQSASDLLIAQGSLGSGAWTTTGLDLPIDVGDRAILFVVADLSLSPVPHGDAIDAAVAGQSDLFWVTGPDVVAPTGFPLDSGGEVIEVDLAVDQIQFAVPPADTLSLGASDVELMQMRVPGDGGLADALERFEILQLGTAEAGIDLAALRLEYRSTVPPQSWNPVAPLVHTGGPEWVASNLGLPIEAPGTELRVVADLTNTARKGRTIRMGLGIDGLVFSSERRGPADRSWSAPAEFVVDATPTLHVSQSPDAGIGTVNLAAVPRSARRVPLLPLNLDLSGVITENLMALEIENAMGPDAEQAQLDAQYALVELFEDVDGDGVAGDFDRWLASGTFDGSGIVRFDTGQPLLELRADAATNLLVTADPSQLARDGERLELALSAAALVELEGPTVVEFSEPTGFATGDAPEIDGREATEFAVRPVAGGLRFGGSNDIPLLDFQLGPNGFAADEFSSLTIEQVGTAATNSLQEVALFLDDGDGVADADDAILGKLQPLSATLWGLDQIKYPLDPGTSPRFWVRGRIGADVLPNSTVQFEVPIDGVMVESSNDGPIDAAISGGPAYVLAASDVVTWIAGSLSPGAVPPTATNRPILELQAFNGYTAPRTANAVTVQIEGSALAVEYLSWSLHVDENGDGQADEDPLTVGAAVSGEIQFAGFEYELPPGEQRVFLVAYSLSASDAADGSTVDALVEEAFDFRFATEDGITQSVGDFPLASPGFDTVDGMVASQVRNNPVGSGSVGAGAAGRLALDLVIPSNGWQSDTMNSLSLTIEPPGTGMPAELSDLSSLALWVETDPAAPAAAFNASEDRLVAVTGPSLRFENFNESIPVGGQRFYVTVDIAPGAVDGRALRLGIPVDGIGVSSANDGPRDQAVISADELLISNRELLTSIAMGSIQLTVGQITTATIIVENQSATDIDSVQVETLALTVPTVASFQGGPSPALLNIPAGEQREFVVQLRAEQPGTAAPQCVVATASGSLTGALTTGSVFAVEATPTSMIVSARSNLPVSVNRGQDGVTPLSWQLSHGDLDSTVAPLEVRALNIEVCDAFGAPQSAATALNRLEIRSGATVHALISTVPDTNRIHLQLDPPIYISPGSMESIPLRVAIADAATATALCFRIEAVDAALVVDANSEQQVAVVALPTWTSEIATIRTPATQANIDGMTGPAPTANQGQTDFEIARLDLSLPGAIGESSAQLTQLALALRDTLGLDLDFGSVFTRIRVVSETTELLDISSVETVGSRAILPLSVPLTLNSQDPVSVSILADVSDLPLANVFTSEWLAESDLLVRDLNSGGVLTIVANDGLGFPRELGTTHIEMPADAPRVSGTALVPEASVAGTTGVQTARFRIVHEGSTASAGISLSSAKCGLMDDSQRLLAPSTVIAEARLYLEGTTDSLVATTTSLSTAAEPAALDLFAPLALAAGDSVTLRLDVDLRGDVAVPWLRFAFESDAFAITDLNDLTRTLIPSQGLPFATPALRVVAPAQELAVGAPEDPVSNLAPGLTNERVLLLRAEHPGSEIEDAVGIENWNLRVQDMSAAPLDATSLIAAARLRAGTETFTATLAGDSLLFELGGSQLQPGNSVEFWLELDLRSDPSVSDFHLAFAATDVIPVAGSPEIIAIDGADLPYRSPSIHVGGLSLEESFAGYPNPFAAGQESARIVFQLAADAQVSLSVYTITGEKVIDLLRGEQLSAGLHDGDRDPRLLWDGRNQDGSVVRNGVYLLRLAASGSAGGEYYWKMAVAR